MIPHDLLAAFETLANAPDGVKRLRELVLSLAVRGKLVVQDPGDDGAAEQLERALAESRLVASGRVAVVHEEETPFEVPAAWRWVYLGDAMNLVNGMAFKPINWSRHGLPIIRIQNLNDPGAPFNYCNFEVPSKFYVSDNDLLLSWSGTPGTSFGAFIWRRGRAVLNQHIFRCEPRGHAFDLEFLRLAVNSRLTEMIQRAHGAVGLRHITRGKLEGLRLPLPPIAEQRSIVARVHELIGLLDRLEAARNTRDELRRAARDAALADLRNAPDPEAVETAWTRIAQQMDDLFTEPEDVTPLRQAVLQLAVQGRLTGDDVEEVMLNDLVDPKRPISYGVLVPGPDFEGGVPLVRIADLDDRRPAPMTGKSINPKVAEQYSRVRLHGDELLLGVVGSIGKVGVASPAWKGAVIARAVVRIGIRPEVHRDYVRYALQSPGVQRYFADSTRTLAQPTLNVGLIRSAPISLPVREAQDRIVSKVQALMTLCDDLEARLNASRDLQGQFASAAVHHLDV